MRVWLFLICWCASLAWGQERVTIAYPGPFNAPLLPLDVARAIGADRAEGLELVPRFASGSGALAYLQSRNVDFAVPGVPAAIVSRSASAIWRAVSNSSMQWPHFCARRQSASHFLLAKCT